MARFLPGMFRAMRAALVPHEAVDPSAAEVDRDREERGQHTAARVREEQREQEEAAYEESLRRASQEEIKRSCEHYGWWAPGEYVPESRLRGGGGGWAEAVHAFFDRYRGGRR